MPSPRLVTRAPFLMIVLALLLAACSLPSTSPAAPPPPPPGQQGGQPPGQPPGGSGAVQIAFTADRAQINPGECVTLKWQVSGPHFGVLLEGEQVPDQGSKQVCPPDSHAFFLQVDTGDHMEERSVQIQVGAGGAPPPPPSGGASPPPPPSSGSASTPSGGIVVATPPPGGAPPVVPGSAMSPSSTATPTMVMGEVMPLALPDLAISALATRHQDSYYLLVVTVTNQGTGNIDGATLSIMCTFTDPFSTPSTLEAAHLTNFDLAAGNSYEVQTGVPLSKSYHVQCTASLDGDADTSNNTMSADLP